MTLYKSFARRLFFWLTSIVLLSISCERFKSSKNFDIFLVLKSFLVYLNDFRLWTDDIFDKLKIKFNWNENYGGWLLFSLSLFNSQEVIFPEFQWKGIKEEILLETCMWGSYYICIYHHREYHIKLNLKNRHFFVQLKFESDSLYHVDWFWKIRYSL